MFKRRKRIWTTMLSTLIVASLVFCDNSTYLLAAQTEAAISEEAVDTNNAEVIVSDDDAQGDAVTVEDDADNEEVTSVTEETVSDNTVSDNEIVDDKSEDETLISEPDLEAGTDISAYLTVDASGTITAYSGTDIKDIVIPSKVNGITVTQIKERVFAEHSEIESVAFPNTLKSIGDNAFYKTALGNKNVFGTLTIPASVEYIGLEAFKECAYLGKVVFENPNDPSAEAIVFRHNWDHSETFAGCKNLKEIELSDRVQNIPNDFAQNCTALVNVKWPAKLKIIGESAFAGCTSLVSSDFSKTMLESVGDYAFKDCSSLEAPQFPATLKTIGVESFANSLMGTRTSLGDIVIPASVDYIGHDAFTKCKYLRSVKFEDYTGDGEVPELQLDIWFGYSRAFTDCEKLETLVLSNRIYNIPAGFANGCKALKNVVYPADLKTIGDCAFQDCISLKSADFSATGLTSIGTSAFAMCSSLDAVKFPKDTLINIEREAFYKTLMGSPDGPSQIVIPASVDRIACRAFSECANLGKVVFEDYKGVGNPSKIDFATYFGSANTFADCPVLSEIVLSNRTQELGEGFARNCSMLTTVSYPENIQVIGSEAFKNCTSLISSDLSNTALVEISNGAFDLCKALPVVKLPKGQPLSIGDYAFATTSMDEDGKPGDLFIPSNVTGIGANAFRECSNLGSVSFGPDNGYVESMNLGHDMLASCPNLSELEVSDRITDIPYNFAYNCEKLSRIKIAGSVKTVGDRAFMVSAYGKVFETRLEGNCQAAKDYDWKGSNRVLVDAVSVVTLNETELELALKETYKLTYTVKTIPEGSPAPDLVWKSSNEYVATVKDGKVTANNTGSANITISTKEGIEKAVCKVRVVKEKIVPVKTLNIDSIDTTVYVGESKKLGLKYTPADATNAKFVWSSSDNRIAAVDGDGKVTGMSKGEALITVTTKDKSKTATCKITVKQRTTGVSLSSKAITLSVGEKTDLLAAPVPEGAEYKSIEFVVGSQDPVTKDKDVISISGSADKVNITAVSPGSAQLKAILKSDEFTVYSICQITVKQAPVDAANNAEADKVKEGLWIVGLDKDGYTFTGTAVKPDVRVYYGVDLLRAGTDYTISYKNNTKIGTDTAQIIITGKGRYSQKHIKTFSIVQCDLGVSNDIVSAVAYKNNKGKLITEVKVCGKALKAGKDYTYEEEADSLIIKGQGNYTGVRKIPVTQSATAAIGKMKINLPKSMPFCGEPVTLSKDELVVSSADGKELKAGQDYSVRYENNRNVGTVNVFITGKTDTYGNGYSGTVKKTFKITPAKLTKENTRVSFAGEAQYAKGGAKVSPVIEWTGASGKVWLLKEGIDYNISFKNNTAVGKTATMTVKGIGCFAGSSLTGYEFKVVKGNVSELFAFASDKVYNAKKSGSAFVSAPVVYDIDGKKLSANKDYKVSYIILNSGVALGKKTKASNGDTIRATITGMGNYAGSTTYADYRLVAKVKSIASAKNPKIAAKEYTGAPVELKPFPELKMGKNEVLIEGDNGYRVVTYFNNVNKGTATVLVKGTGEYCFVKAITFKIDSVKFK